MSKGFSISPPDYPVYVLKVPNPNDYTLFANGGWDGNWYVGYDVCWVKKLPPVPPGSYARAFIGAKLGRMKPSLRGDIWMAISSTPAWTQSQEARLSGAGDIPSEGDASNAIANVGESQWFWAEIPLERVNRKGDNYLALWSPAPDFVSISSSPVLAAAWGGREVDTWLDRSVKGTPPIDPQKALSSGVSYFQPAMALKLIPEGLPPHPVSVRIISWQNGSADHPNPILMASVGGDSIERAWVEYSSDLKTWAKIGRPLWKAPYIFSVDSTAFPPGRLHLRVAAANIWEETGASAPFRIEVSKAHEIRP